MAASPAFLGQQSPPRSLVPPHGELASLQSKKRRLQELLDSARSKMAHKVLSQEMVADSSHAATGISHRVTPAGIGGHVSCRSKGVPLENFKGNYYDASGGSCDRHTNYDTCETVDLTCENPGPLEASLDYDVMMRRVRSTRAAEWPRSNGTPPTLAEDALTAGHGACSVWQGGMIPPPRRASLDFL